MSEAPHLLTEVTEEGILIATLNRPDKLNAISRETMDLLTEAVFRFRDTEEIKVMLIRATGRYFSAGADLVHQLGKIDFVLALVSFGNLSNHSVTPAA